MEAEKKAGNVQIYGNAVPHLKNKIIIVDCD